MEKARIQMVQMMNAMTEENLRLRMQLMEEKEARYNTPENLSAGGVDARREELPPPTEADVNDAGSDDLQQEEVPHEQTARGGGTSEGTSTEQAMTLMLEIVQSMHQMQEQLLKGQTGKKSAKEDGPEETEVIRGGIELHRLPEWSIESAPVDFQDWLLLVPLVGASWALDP